METLVFLIFFGGGGVGGNYIAKIIWIYCVFLLQFVTDLLFLESVMFVLRVVWRN